MLEPDSNSSWHTDNSWIDSSSWYNSYNSDYSGSFSSYDFGYADYGYFGFAGDPATVEATLNTGDRLFADDTAAFKDSGTTRGAVIRLEDTAQTPLVSADDGVLVYAGTDATFLQVMQLDVLPALKDGDSYY